jgi:hypothetical protein
VSARYAPGSATYAPTSIDPARTRRAECETCGRPLVFVRMQSGALMPCDPGMQPGDGRRHLVVRDARLIGRLVPRAPEELSGLEPHFGTCPCRPRKIASGSPTLFDALPDG